MATIFLEDKSSFGATASESGPVLIVSITVKPRMKKLPADAQQGRPYMWSLAGNLSSIHLDISGRSRPSSPCDVPLRSCRWTNCGPTGSYAVIDSLSQLLFLM